MALASLAACGAAEVEGVAHERALDLLTERVADALECLTAIAPRLESVQAEAKLPHALSECADTAPPTAGEVWMSEERGGPTIVFSSTIAETSVVLDMMSTATAPAQAGVANARAYVATCWRATIDRVAGRLTGLAGAACNDALVTAYSGAAEVLPFSELDLP